MTDQAFGYMVDIDQYCTHSKFAEERFGDWSESYINTFKKIYKRTAPGSPDIISMHDFAQGEEVYVVWVEYSKGDSFGWADRGGIEAVTVVKDYFTAVEIQTWIEQTTVRTNWEYTQDFIASNGENFKIYVGQWLGYFEHLETVNIEHTIISVP
jgi:hypothetical protein